MSLLFEKEINPFVRAVKIKKSSQLVGTWKDIDNLFIYIAKGSCEYYTDGRVCSMKAGDCIVFPPFMVHELRKGTNHAVVQYIMHFDWFENKDRVLLEHKPLEKYHSVPEISKDEFPLGEDVFVVSFPEEERSAVERLFLNLYREFEHKKPGYRLMEKAICMQLLTLAIRASAENGGASEKRKPGHQSSGQIVNKVMEYIYLHYSEQLSNKRLGEVVGVSPNYLSKLFQKHTGVTLHNYLIQYRLEKARDFLVSAECNISEVAIKCGFSSISSFSKSFKARWGTNPSDYIKTAGLENLLAINSDYDPDRHLYYNE